MAHLLSKNHHFKYRKDFILFKAAGLVAAVAAVVAVAAAALLRTVK